MFRPHRRRFAIRAASKSKHRNRTGSHGANARAAIRWWRTLLDAPTDYTIRPARTSPAAIVVKKWGLLLPGAPEPRLMLLRHQGFKIGISNRLRGL